MVIGSSLCVALYAQSLIILYFGQRQVCIVKPDKN